MYKQYMHINIKTMKQMLPLYHTQVCIIQNSFCAVFSLYKRTKCPEKECQFITPNIYSKKLLLNRIDEYFINFVYPCSSMNSWIV
jgi:hypothetical protein